MDVSNKLKTCIKHETKRRSLIKFLVIFLVVVAYFVFISFKYGIENGFPITILTWSFFVFCTPIADAGFLFDFPIRILANIRMIYSEIIVWCTAILINAYFLIFDKGVYKSTKLLALFKYILVHPFPLWLIILISAAGTFTSVYFGDELIDVVKHKHRKKYEKHKNKYLMIVAVFSLLIILLVLYYSLISGLGINY